MNGEKQLTSASVMHNYKLGAPRNVSKNKSILSNNNLLHEEKGKYELFNPAFELWFLKQLFNQDYSKKLET